MENRNSQQESYYTLVLDKLGENLKETVELMQKKLCYGRADAIERIVLLPCIVAKGLVLQDAELLRCKLAELGNEVSIYEDTEIVSFLEQEAVSAPNEVLLTEIPSFLCRKLAKSVLMKCMICKGMVEQGNLEAFTFQSCPHCGASPMLTESQYKRLRFAKEEGGKRK